MSNRICTLFLASTALVPLGLAAAVANPLGAQVVGGNANVQGQGTANVTVTQTTDKAIVNWNTFNIGSNEATRFVQPNSTSIALNRVTGGLGPSQLFGILSANGRIFVVNPDGILFGPGAKIDTAGFLATTHDIANADFMAGRYNFSIPGRPGASVVNAGTITANNGGFAALVAPGVRNSGTITANLGTVALASGNGFTLDFYGDKLIALGVNDTVAAQVKDVATGQPLNALVKNEGTLKANGGRVELTASAARTVVDSVINNTGVIEANTIGTRNGMIVLSAATDASKPADTPTQTVKVSGKLSAAGNEQASKGGTIKITGQAIALTGATLDASGRNGGGTVLIGGDVGGGNPNAAVASIPQAKLQPYAVPTASTVAVDAATTIDASAKDAGDGGKVVVWSDQSTLFDGRISVRGGSTFGNGGFVETSGHTLGFAGARVDTSALKGLSGLWLLDPYDLTIDGTAAGTIAANLATTDVTLQTTAFGTSGPGVQSAGEGDIFVNSPVSWNSAHSLTVSAYRNIWVNANIANGGTGNITGRADNTGTGVGTVTGVPGKTVSTGGAVSVFYNPSVNPAGSPVNGTSYLNPVEDFSTRVTAGGGLTAYMLVNTVYDLQNIKNNLSGTYALGKDIDASATAGWNGVAGFAPIGSFSYFTGQFNGQGLTIRDLFIAPTGSNNYATGLFGFIGAGGVVKNLHLANVDIHANPNLSGGYLGALAGLSVGLIDNVTASGTISGGTASGLSAGGLVGQNTLLIGSTVASGLIQNSSAAVDITLGKGIGCGTLCAAYRAGGLAGDNWSTITGSSASGNVVVGANASGGGLVGGNIGTITGSSATGNVSSTGVNVQLGGLVGYNSPGAFILRSHATGNVTATATLAANTGLDCSISGSNCQYETAGGLVGSNSGTIQGNAVVPVLTQPCVPGQACATGAVSVGSSGAAGGLVGWNDGIISNAFATGAVTGAAGLSGIGTSGKEHSTELGGLAASNKGLITNSFATGNVGTLNVANLNVGGLLADNSGTVLDSFATGQARAGDNSQAGGLTANNGPWNILSCTGCLLGDGSAYFNTAFIGNSHATGNVTVGAASLAGGLSGSGDRTSTFENSYATGAVSGGGNGILGGLIGVTDVGATVTDSTTAVTSTVTSTGSNSWVGGFIGLNSGTILDSHALAAVNGTSDSLLGGFAGLNFGVITDSTTTAAVTANGNNNYIGGFAGLNFGFIDPSTSAGAVTANGNNNVVGGFAGANASLASIPAGLIAGSSFPNGTISVDSLATGPATGTGTNNTVNAQVGTTSPSTLPAAPSLIAGCDSGVLCAILNAGLKLASIDTVALDPVPPPITQVAQLKSPLDDNATTPAPILASLTTPSSSAGSPPAGAASNGGPGKSGFVPPPLPARSVPGPHGETRSSVPPPGENRFFPNQVLLQLELNIPDSELTRIAQGLGLRIVTSDTLTALGRRVVRLELPSGMSVRDAIRRLEANRLVSVAAPVYQFNLVQVIGTISKGDPAQYMLGTLRLDQAHAIASGKGVTIALIDSEIDKQHAELQGAIPEELDALGVKESPHSHGTAMAGAIVAHNRLLGIAPGAKILAVRAFGKSNNTAEGTTLSILKGIEWAVSQGAKIINMSFAGPRDPSLERALKAAHDKGVVLIAAAGNAGPKSPPLYPGADPNVIAVTATDVHDQLFRGANQGLQVSVAAPGVDILAPAPDENYQMSTGTSIATAHVSGVVALMLERDPTLKPDNVRKILESTATDLGPKGKDNQFGWGLINPQKALEAIDVQLTTAGHYRRASRD